MARERFVFRDGKFVKEEAKGTSQIAEHLRALPGEFVAKDIDDPDHIHELDPAHVVGDMKFDLEKKYLGEHVDKRDVLVMARAERMKKAFEVIPPGDRAPLTQARIDAVRLRVINELIQSAHACMKRGEDYGYLMKPHHIWFPEKDNVNNTELRRGNPPSDYGRPKHMRGFDILIDITNWPRVIQERLAEYGLKMPTIEDMLAKVQEEADVDARPAARLDR